MGLTRTLTEAPGRTVLLTIALTIGLGTMLLMLPLAQAHTVAPIDCLFTATSATCVTGALTVPFDSFSFFGKCVILGLIQIGGIGLLTVWLFLVALFTNLGLSTKFMLGRILELSAFKNARQVLFFIIGITFVAELIGAVALYYVIADEYDTLQGIFHALFHSVSSFCNAGFSSFGPTSLVPFRDNVPFLGITAALILAGGIGFITLHELFLYCYNRLKGKRFHLSLTTTVILTMTGLLIPCVTLLLMALEGPALLVTQSWVTVLSDMAFNAISFRSVGLTTLSVTDMQTATILLIMMYSFIGSSPVSTGSGIKITTFALFLATIRAVVNGRMEVDLHHRQVPDDQIFKAIAVLSVSLCWLAASTFLLTLCEVQSSFLEIFFEAVSAFTNLGLATALTPSLTIAGKLIIIVNMFMGRVGILTLMLALRVVHGRSEFHYPQERLMMS